MSGGEQQRVARARSLLSAARIILDNEPTGNLDAENGEAVMGVLKSGNGIIYEAVFIASWTVGDFL